MGAECAHFVLCRFAADLTAEAESMGSFAELSIYPGLPHLNDFRRAGTHD